MITAVPGRHNVANIVAAMAVARCLGVGPDRLQDAVGRLRPAAMRGKICRSGGVTLIDDCYNANPAAVEAMLEVLRRTSARRRIAVLGEMRELGVRSRELHRRIGQAVSAAGLDYLVAVGGDAVKSRPPQTCPASFTTTRRRPPEPWLGNSDRATPCYSRLPGCGSGTRARRAARGNGSHRSGGKDFGLGSDVVPVLV